MPAKPTFARAALRRRGNRRGIAFATLHLPFTMARSESVPTGLSLPVADAISLGYRETNTGAGEPARQEGFVTTAEREVVAALGPAICQRIGEPRYQLWFIHKTKFTWHDGQLLVGVPNHFYQEWLRKQFADVVRVAAAEVAGRAAEVKFVIDAE